MWSMWRNDAGTPKSESNQNRDENESIAPDIAVFILRLWAFSLCSSFISTSADQVF
jgi:hypothetical protein